jgi:diguanylate cyclase (GGDEF)-like protein/PAS domain S-box-containing protein
MSGKSLPTERQQLLDDTRPFLVIIAVAYILFLGLVGVAAWMKLSSFIDYQEKIATSTASGAALEIRRYISDLEHHIDNFTRNHTAQLSALSTNPGDSTTRAYLEYQLKQDVPEAFTFTIANSDGSPIQEEFENPIARARQADIRQFAATRRNHIAFHPSPVTNHFDVMAVFQHYSGKELIFFASFNADILSPFLAENQLPGYATHITSINSPDLIDISTQGSRDNLGRDTRLNTSELRRLNATVGIEGTNWQVVKIPDWSLYKHELYGVLWRVVVAILLSTVIALVMLRLIIKYHRSQRRSEQRYQQLFYANKAPMMLLDPDDGLIIDVNRAAEQFYGYDETLKGRHASIISNVPKDEIDARLSRAANGEQDQFISEHQLSSGETREVEIRSGPIEIDGKTILYSIINDITARKQAEKALLESELRFKTLTNLSPVGTFFTDAAGICSYVNQAWADITGIDASEWTGKTWTDVVTSNDRETTIADWSKSVLKQGDYEVECRIQRPDGSIRWILCRATGVQSFEDSLVSYIGTAVDITDRKKHEHELRLLATSFEAYEPIIITDGRARILRVNDAFLRSSGYSEEELLGKNPSMFSAGETDPAFYQEMWEQLTEHGNWSGEFLNRTRSGDLHQDWVTITALKDDKGKTINYIGHYLDITERRQAEEQIRRLAFYDPLTNLPNRRLFLERLDQELHIARNENKFSALLFLDLDHFKNLNDSLGHPVGDALLIEVSKRLQRTRSEGEIIARIGGDEFVILLPDLADSMDQLSNVAAHRAEQASRIITQPYYIQGHEYHITVSIGIDLFPEEDQDSTDILKRADTAMYRAKHAGRNTICFFEPEMQISADRRLTLEKDLRHAVAQDELYLVYQPMIDWQGNVIGAEVLLRWQHSKMGSIQPSDFIPIAEDTGMIFEISEWILNNVCQQLRSWKDAGLTDHLKTVAVNLSPKQFSQPGFEDTVLEIVNRHGVDPACIEFEITEGLIISNLKNTVVRMQGMREHGFHFSVDDFGTGYSSLAYLKQLPINRLKIDRSFVSDITEGSNDATIVETIISMAHHLGLEVVAEGVENRMQHYFLMQHSCDIYQGHYFSKPLLPDEFVQLEITQSKQLTVIQE